MEGSTLTYTECADGYTLKGTKEYTCILNAEGHAQWSSQVDTECAGMLFYCALKTAAKSIPTTDYSLSSFL